MKRLTTMVFACLLMVSMSGCILGPQYMYEAPNGDVCLSNPENGTYLPPPMTRLTNGTVMPGLMSTDQGPVQFYSPNCKRAIKMIEPGGRISIGNVAPAYASLTIEGMASYPPAYLNHWRGIGFQQAVLSYSGGAIGQGPWGLVAENIFVEWSFSGVYGDRWKEAKAAYLAKQKAAVEKPLEMRFEAKKGGVGASVEAAILKQLKDISERLEKLEKH